MTPPKTPTKALTPTKNDQLTQLVEDVKKTMGKSLVVLRDVPYWIPTGIPQLDIALGAGLPVSRMITLIGRKSVGKSTLAIHCAAQIQKAKGIVLGMDVERSNLKTRCEKQGLDLDLYLATQPESLDTFERTNPATGKKEKVKGAFDIMAETLALIQNKAPGTLVGIVLDSVAGSSVAQEKEGNVGDASYGRHSLILSQAFRMVMPMIHDLDAVFILVNQLKDKIGVVYGSPNTYIGKNPIDFHSAITLEMTSGGPWPPKSDTPEGIITKVFVSKNKVGVPFGRCQYVTFFDRGIDPLFEAINFLRDEGFFGTTVGWLTYKGTNYRLADLMALIKGDPATAKAIHEIATRRVHEKIHGIASSPVSPALSETAAA